MRMYFSYSCSSTLILLLFSVYFLSSSIIIFWRLPPTEAPHSPFLLSFPSLLHSAMQAYLSYSGLMSTSSTDWNASARTMRPAVVYLNREDRESHTGVGTYT